MRGKYKKPLLVMCPSVWSLNSQQSADSASQYTESLCSRASLARASNPIITPQATKVHPALAAF